MSVLILTNILTQDTMTGAVIPMVSEQTTNRCCNNINGFRTRHNAGCTYVDDFMRTMENLQKNSLLLSNFGQWWLHILEMQILQLEDIKVQSLALKSGWCTLLWINGSCLYHCRSGNIHLPIFHRQLRVSSKGQDICKMHQSCWKVGYFEVW